MSAFEVAQQWVGAVGGLGVLGLMVRAIYRSLSKTHRQAVNADTTRDLVEVATSLLGPAEEQVTRLSNRLAEAEARASKLEARIVELQAEALAQSRENESLRLQMNDLKAQLVDAQLEAIRLRGLLSMDSGPHSP